MTAAEIAALLLFVLIGCGESPATEEYVIRPSMTSTTTLSLDPRFHGEIVPTGTLTLTKQTAVQFTPTQCHNSNVDAANCLAAALRVVRADFGPVMSDAIRDEIDAALKGTP